jgi:hypothetical protein
MDALGPIVREYPLRWGKQVAMGLGAFVLGAALLYGAARAYNAPGSVMVMVVAFGGFGAFCVLGGLGAVVMALAQWGAKMALHANGLVHHHRGKAYTYLWTDLTVRRKVVETHEQSGGGVPYRTDYTYTLRRADGRQLELSSDYGDGMIELGDIVVDQVNRVALPRALAALRRGETLTFGPLRLDMFGVASGKERIDWLSVKEIRVQGGEVKVWTLFPAKQQAFHMPEVFANLADIPDADVFLTLAKQLHSTQGLRGGRA